MREGSDDDHDAWLRAMREVARRDVEALVPHPRHRVYGLASPGLTPAVVGDQTLVNGESTSITLAYGDGEAPDGPYVSVITSAADAFAVPRAGSTTLDGAQAEASLRFAVDDERDRATAWPEATEPNPAGRNVVGPDPAGPDEPPAVTWESLPVGRALFCRAGSVWAARLRPADADADAGADADHDAGVVVTIIGRGLAPESVRLRLVTDLRPMVEARNALIGARIERARRRPRPPAPELEPAEGVAALLALAEITLAEHAELQAELAAHRRPRSDPAAGRLRHALWQRAVREHQRLRGTDRFTADDAVTVAVNHLGFLLEKAPWFTADPRLRAAATDETLRHAMLAEIVPSETAQDAWARFWSARQTWRRNDDGEAADEHARVLAWAHARDALADDCLRAWAAWTQNAR
jgi:hypothetical protein